jgi:predicted transcriptional regulator of viral defense system
VWVAISGKAWCPVIRDLPVRIVRFSGQALAAGHAPHTVEGVSLRVTTPAKTVADCFKFRNKLGLDVALEALREGWRAKRFTLDELWRFAQVDRVARVLRPYLESLE